MAKLKLPYYGKLLAEAFQELDRLNFYSLYDNFHFFQVLIPGYKQTFTGTILGSAREFYGFNLFVGEDGFEKYMAICQDRIGNINAELRKMNLYTVEIIPADSLSFENRKWLKSAGVKIQQSENYPDFNVHKAGKAVTVPNDEDVKIMLYAMKGMLKAIKTNVFEPSDIRTYNKIFTIKTTGKPIDPEIEILNAPIQEKQDNKQLLDIDLDSYQKQSFEFVGLPRFDKPWAVFTFPLPAVIHDDLTSVLCVVDVFKGPRLQELLVGDEQNDPNKIWEKLKDMLKGKSKYEDLKQEPGLPNEFIFYDPVLYQIAQKVFSPLKIKCTLSSKDTELYEILENLSSFMYEHFSKGPKEALESLKETMPDDIFEDILDEQLIVSDSIPDLDDHKDWVNLDRKFKIMVFENFENNKKFKTDRALKTYFGDLRDYYDIKSYDDIFKKFDLRWVVDSYCFWLISNYRATYKSYTITEKWLLNKKIKNEMKYVIDEFSFGRSSIFEIYIKNREEGKVLLIDFLDIERDEFEIIDFELAKTAQSGIYLPATVYTLGDFDFYAIMGPILNGNQLDKLRDFFIDQENVYLEDDILDYRPELFGKIWQFLSKEQISNSAADDNQSSTASTFCTRVYKVINKAQVCKQLRTLTSIDYNKKEDRYIWFYPKTSTPLLPGIESDCIEVLAILKFDKDKLLVEIKSEKRHEKCRRWLEKFKGLEFEKILPY